MNSINKYKLNFTSEEKQRFEEIKIQLDFLRLIQKEMNYQDMSRQDLANILGVNRSFVSQLFSGSKKINLRIIQKMKDALGIEISITVKKRQQQKMKALFLATKKSDSYYTNPESRYEWVGHYKVAESQIESMINQVTKEESSINA
jgi:ribosome-binding protein aMBF1 (putative translation factor)